MNQVFTAYGAAILAVFMWASYEGYAVSSPNLYSHHTGGAGGHSYYHK